MAAAYHGGTSSSQTWVNSSALHQDISNAMDWWFARDFTTSDCLYNGGNGNCPCGTAGMWNTNWFSNVSQIRSQPGRPTQELAQVILVPLLVAQSCMILNTTLSATQTSNCSHMTTRAYSPFYDKVQQVLPLCTLSK
jgi:hypothetical protein